MFDPYVEVLKTACEVAATFVVTVLEVTGTALENGAVTVAAGLAMVTAFWVGTITRLKVPGDASV